MYSSVAARFQLRAKFHRHIFSSSANISAGGSVVELTPGFVSQPMQLAFQEFPKCGINLICWCKHRLTWSVSLKYSLRQFRTFPPSSAQDTVSFHFHINVNFYHTEPFRDPLWSPDFSLRVSLSSPLIFIPSSLPSQFTFTFARASPRPRTPAPHS